MANPKSCTRIKVNGVRCESPALRGEQFCDFHQHAHREVRRPPRSRLHPMAADRQPGVDPSVADGGDQRPAAQHTDAKRAGLILRALNMAVRNARNLKFDNLVYPKATEVPEYAEPETENVETAAVANEYLPAVAAVT